MNETIHWLGKLCRTLELGCEEYQKTAPAVCDWMDDLYRRINEQPAEVLLPELLLAERLASDGWTPPNLAQNQLYHLLHRLGRLTVGMSDY